MRLYRTKYKDRNGKMKLCDEWYLTFNDRAGSRRRLKAYTNKGETAKLGIEIETVMNNNGRLGTDTDKRWFSDLMPRIQSKLIEWGIVDGRNTIDHLTTPLSEHLKVFIESRNARGCSAEHIKRTKRNILYVLNGCSFKLWCDFDAPAAESFLVKGRGSNGYGEGTYNGYLRSIKSFSKWLSEERELSPDPLARIKLIKQTEYRKERRILSADEKSKLLSATINGEAHSKMSAFARYLVYRIATECGLRYSEIKSLRVLSFDLDADPPTVYTEAMHSKGKESDYLILNNETAGEIKAFLADKKPTDPAFKLPHVCNAAKMLRLDLAAAGIPYTDDAGRDVDFHSLKHKFITDLFIAGVPATVVQKLARHKDLKTTMIYSHVTLTDQVSAIRKLRPVLTKTGQNTIQPRTSVDISGLKKVDLQTKNALSA